MADGSGPTPNQNTPPIVNNTIPSHNVYVNIPNNPVPKFNGDSDSFQVWKGCMLLHIAGVERYLTTVLTEGPYVPYVTTSVALNTDGSPRRTPKPQDQWSEEDRRLVDLDTKLMNMIISAIPPTLVPTLILFKNAKTMWDELLTQFEGTADTIATRKVALNKKYETFFAIPNESLTDTYIRFTSLLNQLEGLGVKKDKEIVLEKFCDILPSKWGMMILVLRQSKTLHSHTLNSLYGAFRYTQENNTDRAVAEQDSINHLSNNSSRPVQNFEPVGTALVSSESKNSLMEIMDSLYSSELMDNVSHECEETDNDDLMCMVAKTFNRFRARSNASFASTSNSKIDKTNLTCFKCGRKGHFMKECRSSQSSQPSTSSSNKFFPRKSEDTYKSKYKQMKAQLALLNMEKPEKNGCLLAKTDAWDDSDDSSEDEEEERDLCFMALEDQKHLVKDDVVSGRWVDIMLKKVSDFGDLTENEQKMDSLCLINCDLLFIENVRSECFKSFETCSTELNACKKQLTELKDVHLSLKSQEFACAKLEKEKDELIAQVEHERKIIRSWSHASNLSFNAVADQVPHQVRAMLDGNLEKAANIPDLYKNNSQILTKTETETILVSDPSKNVDLKEVKSESCMVPLDYASENFKSSGTEKSHVKPGSTLSQACASAVTSQMKSPHVSSNNVQTKKKNLTPKPKIVISEKAKVSTQDEFLLRIESQFESLARQVQSCNSRINHFHHLSLKPKNTPNLRKSGVKKVIKNLKLPKTFVPESNQKQSSKETSTSVSQTKVTSVKSSEPISRWVPKNN